MWGWGITDSKITAWQVKVMNYSVRHTCGGKMYPETYPGTVNVAPPVLSRGEWLCCWTGVQLNGYSTCLACMTRWFYLQHGGAQLQS